MDSCSRRNGKIYRDINFTHKKEQNPFELTNSLQNAQQILFINKYKQKAFPKLERLFNIILSLKKETFEILFMRFLPSQEFVSVVTLLLRLLKEYFEEQNHHHVLVYYNRKPNGVHEVFHLPSYHECA